MNNATKAMMAACAAVLAALAPAKENAAGEKPEKPKLAAETVRMKCPVCRGRGELKVRPPDIGQYGGLITNRSHWDVKLDPCPVCGRGNGSVTVWDLSHPEPSAEPPCTTCGWSGIVQCRKCLASGLTDCRNRNCSDGWVLPDNQRRQRRGTAKVKPSEVRPCADCKGVGKVPCADCRGMRATLCRKCHGVGRKMR